MVIKKILNNNFVIVQEQETEKIIMGRGIAFNKKVGQKIDKNRIQKIFYLENTDFDQRLSYLANEIPMEIFQIVEELVQLYKEKFGKTVSDTIYLSLSDHLNYSLTRSKDEYTYKNMLIWDIDKFYPEEYLIGKHGVERVQQLLTISLPREEAGFITLHLLNADSGIGEKGEVQKVIQIVQEVTDIIRYYLGIEFDTSSMHYQRLITHVRFFAQRVVKGIYSEERLANDEFLALLKDKYIDTYHCVLKIGEHMLNKYDFPLATEEKMYLTLHIQKIVS